MGIKVTAFSVTVREVQNIDVDEGTNVATFRNLLYAANFDVNGSVARIHRKGHPIMIGRTDSVVLQQDDCVEFFRDSKTIVSKDVKILPNTCRPCCGCR